MYKRAMDIDIGEVKRVSTEESDEDILAKARL